MSLVNLTINGKAVSVPSDTKILEAAKQVNVKTTKPMSFTYG